MGASDRTLSPMRGCECRICLATQRVGVLLRPRVWHGVHGATRPRRVAVFLRHACGRRRVPCGTVSRGRGARLAVPTVAARTRRARRLCGRLWPSPGVAGCRCRAPFPMPSPSPCAVPGRTVCRSPGVTVAVCVAVCRHRVPVPGVPCRVWCPVPCVAVCGGRATVTRNGTGCVPDAVPSRREKRHRVCRPRCRFYSPCGAIR